MPSSVITLQAAASDPAGAAPVPGPRLRADCRQASRQQEHQGKGEGIVWQLRKGGREILTVKLGQLGLKGKGENSLAVKDIVGTAWQSRKWVVQLGSQGQGTRQRQQFLLLD